MESIRCAIAACLIGVFLFGALPLGCSDDTFDDGLPDADADTDNDSDSDSDTDGYDDAWECLICK